MGKIYVHLLENTKYYVGKSDDLDVKIGDCINYDVCEWTTQNKPISIIDVIHNSDRYDLDKQTVACMDKYGIENVRGGSFVNYVLTKEDLSIINDILTNKSYQLNEFKRDFAPFSIEEYKQRQHNTIQLMKKHKVGLLIVSRPENIFYLTGYQTPGNPVQVLIIYNEQMHIITRELESTNAMYRAFATFSFFTEDDDPIDVIFKYIKNFDFKSIGFEYNSERMTFCNQVQLEQLLKDSIKDIEFIDCSTLISKLRVIKSPAEIDYIRQAASFSEAGIHEIVKTVKPGMTEAEIAGIITNKMMSLGAVYSSYPCFVSAGYTGCMGHYAAENKTLFNDEILFLEIGGCAKRYHSARMHAIYIGDNPPNWFTEARDLLRLAVREAKGKMVPGTLACEIDKIARDIISEYKYPHTQSERSGYSIGIGFYTDWSENDVFQMNPHSKDVLEENMTIHLIPWINIPEKGAMGFSDTVLVTKNGGVSMFENESISNYDKRTRFILKHDLGPKTKETETVVEYFNSNIEEVVEFHKKNDLCEPTQLVVNENIEGINRLYIKDESSRMGQKAFKVLGVSYAVNKLEQEGQLKKGDTVTTMTDGNHGSALSCIAQQRGYNAVIFVPGNMTEERVNTIKGYGAECQIIDGSYDDCIEVVKQKAKDNNWVLISDTSWNGYESIPKNIVCGYATIFNEVNVLLQKEEKPTHIFLQVGVGGLGAAGIAYAVSRMNPVPKLICVEPDDADCIFENAKMSSLEGNLMCKGSTNSIMSGLNCGVPSAVTWPLLRDYISAYIAIGDEWAREAVRMLYHDNQRILSGESGAAGLAGLLACLDSNELKSHLELNENSNVLIVNTEGVTDKKSFNSIIGYDFFK